MELPLKYPDILSEKNFRENIIPVRVKRRKELGRDYQRINYTLV